MNDNSDNQVKECISVDCKREACIKISKNHFIVVWFNYKTQTYTIDLTLSDGSELFYVLDKDLSDYRVRLRYWREKLFKVFYVIDNSDRYTNLLEFEILENWLDELSVDLPKTLREIVKWEKLNGTD